MNVADQIVSFEFSSIDLRNKAHQNTEQYRDIKPKKRCTINKK